MNWEISRFQEMFVSMPLHNNISDVHKVNRFSVSLMESATIVPDPQIMMNFAYEQLVADKISMGSMTRRPAQTSIKMKSSLTVQARPIRSQASELRYHFWEMAQKWLDITSVWYSSWCHSVVLYHPGCWQYNGHRWDKWTFYLIAATQKKVRSFHLFT